jgi:hypothetical protein
MESKFRNPLYWHFWFNIAIVWLSGFALGIMVAQ